MSNVAIKVENLSKQYRLGEVGTGTISHDLNRWWHRIRGKEDPYLKIGETNDRTSKGNSEYVWALEDINFEVRQGEVLGIIGKNGAGKSTLLKILSKVTAPTTGAIKAKGRIAALLEVGTGFHPELTGRENIYLNGTILGMRRAEVSAKLDEIVDFAGVARYLDTPVKRYSSGMMVRLGFAVAAHLEPEILIVDEVLAVGDAEFQKKAIGKMQEVSQGQGRTVLFVSHNMGSIKSLCKSAIFIKNGEIKYTGDVDSCIEKYYNSQERKKALSFKGDLAKSINIHSVTVNLKDPFTHSSIITPKENIEIIFRYVSDIELIARAGFTFFKENVRLFTLHDTPVPKKILKNTITQSLFKIPKYFIRPGKYQIGFGFYADDTFGEWMWNDDLFEIEVLPEWDFQNDQRAFGIINMPHELGERT